MNIAPWVASGLLLDIGYVAPVLWWASFGGFAVFFWLLAREQALRGAFRGSYITGGAAYLSAFFALYWSTLPLSWLGISSPVLAVAFILLAWSTTALAFAAVFAACMGLAWYVARDTWRMLLAAPAALVLVEWLGPICYSVVYAGAHSLIGPDYTIGSFAYPLAADSALLQLAPLGGIYAMSAALALIAALMMRAARTAQTREYHAALALLALGGVCWLAVHAWLAHTPAPHEGAPIPAALISTNEAPVFSPDASQLGLRYQTLRAFVSQAAARGAQLIVLPEDSRFLELVHDTHDSEFLPAGAAPLIIASASEFEGDTQYSRIEYYDAASAVSQYSYKQMPMAFGEYLPYLFRGAGELLGQGALVSHLLQGRGFSTKQSAGPVVARGISFGVSLCEEGLSPRLYRDEVAGGATLIVNLASHAWFHGSRLVATLALRASQLRAAETHRYVLRAADAAPSLMLDPYGRVVVHSVQGSPGVLFVTAYQVHGATPYVRFGPWLVWLSLLVLSAMVAAAARGQYPHKHEQRP